MKVGIVNIGDEILIGQILNTNAQWMSQKMTNAGFEVYESVTIADDAQQIKETVRYLSEQTDIILMTGGLGPTKDDITKKTLCEYFGTELIYSDEVLKNIENLWKDRPYAVNELTKTQAFVPKDCLVIQNKVGTAPITCFEYDNKILISLPGVPYEMKYNMEQEIIPILQNRYLSEAYIYINILIKNFTESALAMHLEDFENQMPDYIHLAYLPSPRLVKLRLFTRGIQNRQIFDNEFDKLCSLLEKHIIAKEDIPLEIILANKLKEKGLTIGTAESCTGGNLSHLITLHPGASEYYKGSIISYSNEVKINVLGVSPSLLEEKGAVSEQVVEQMSGAVQRILDVDCAIAISGVAGPDGGTNESPVGTVWISTRVKNETKSICYHFGNYREANITSACNSAMIQLIEIIDKL